ncbi:glycosyltransferase [Segatella hominis]|uniref:glycosyltransferase n=1 Tax=Segatella hominis TaxID=2518605 RepID=UPI003AADDE43
MKVVHITKLPDGGASWCAMRICRALRKQGIDAEMLLMQGQSSSHISIVEADWLYRQYDNIVVRLLVKILKLFFRPRFEYLIHKRKQAEKTCKAFFTSPVTGYTSLANHPLVKEADVVHLHWISDFVDFPTFFKRVRKPIVWTIHDENPGLGGFHYLSHKEEASKEYLRLDKVYENIKRKALEKGNRPHLVAISSYMRDFFKKSPVLRDCTTTLIHNGVDCKVFHSLPKAECRAKLGIPLDKKVFLFSSYQIEDKRKGLQVLIPALDSLHDNSIMLVCLGNYKIVPQTEFIQLRCEGLVKGSDLLSEYYSAADYFVLSSFQEAFAQTPLEALACGTPVIAFPCSGVPDLINPKIGVMSENFTKEALMDAIKKAMNTEYCHDKIINDVESRFSYDIIAKQYIELYNQLLKYK